MYGLHRDIHYIRNDTEKKEEKKGYDKGRERKEKEKGRSVGSHPRNGALSVIVFSIGRFGYAGGGVVGCNPVTQSEVHGSCLVFLGLEAEFVDRRDGIQFSGICKALDEAARDMRKRSA